MYVNHEGTEYPFRLSSELQQDITHIFAKIIISLREGLDDFQDKCRAVFKQIRAASSALQAELKQKGEGRLDPSEHIYWQKESDIGYLFQTSSILADLASSCNVEPEDAKASDPDDPRAERIRAAQKSAKAKVNEILEYGRKVPDPSIASDTSSDQSGSASNASTGTNFR